MWMVGENAQGRPGPVAQGPAYAKELVFSLLDLRKPWEFFKQGYNKILQCLGEFCLLGLRLRPQRREPHRGSDRQGEA